MEKKEIMRILITGGAGFVGANLAKHFNIRGIMKLSAIVPSIRPKNLYRLYLSLINAYSGEFEFIVVSPYELPPELDQFNNVRLIKSFASPTVAMQIGILNATGEYIAWGLADDGAFEKDSLNFAFSKLDDDYKTVIMGKYNEGAENPVMAGNEYYILSNHDACRSEYIEPGRLMFNVGIITKQVLAEIGGLDCQFEVLPMAFNDIAIRLQRYGCKFIVQDEIMFRCSHLPGHEGDHGPIHDAQTLHDQDLFIRLYRKQGGGRIIVPFNNYKNQPEKWERRFGL